MDTYRITPADELRFWSKVDKSGSCWIWTGGLKSSGYGRIVIDQRVRVAHRVSYKMANGDVPDGLLVDHICHERKCVKPEHLRLASNKQNGENRSGAQANSTSGVRGVSRHGNKWFAKVEHNKHQYYVGLFEDIADAEAAVIAKRNELFTHNAMDRQAA